MPDGLACPSCGGRSFERDRNILDVWFDSGSSHEAVLPAYAGPDMAGRHVSRRQRSAPRLVPQLAAVGIGTRGRAPFRQVLTHGFVVDEHGRKMSKSLGNTVAPQDVIKQSGAEILRLWVSMVDYGEEVRFRPRDPLPGRRGLSQVPQRAACLAGEPVRLRSQCRTPCRRQTCWRLIVG